MKISYNESRRIFSIETENAGYYLGLVDKDNFVAHIHYGKKVSCEDDLLSLLRINDYPWTPEKLNRERVPFFDYLQFEYPCGGIGDFRESCLEVRNANGKYAVDLRYESHEIINGKPHLEDLPQTFAKENECMTLIVHCKDDVLGLKVALRYTIFEGLDVIARSVYIENCGKETLALAKVYSLALDLENKDYDMVSLHGTWAREKHIQRQRVIFGEQKVSSIRGISSAQESSFIALAEHSATDETGEVFGFNLIYSGNFMSQVQMNQFNNIRVTTGINAEKFEWPLKPGEHFTSPEAVIVYSDKGFGKMTRTFHDLWRSHLIRGMYADRMRPVLINNWEATYFDFDTEKLISIAREAAKDGIELLVMDDGWFGKRNDDNSSLGDWVVNENKLKGGIKYLVDEVNKLGLKFGIWFEPEMVCPDSDLFRTHPDWAISIENRTPGLSRNQLVLDITRKEVRDYVFDSISKVLKSANIEYVKWDMNRPLTDVGSYALSKENAGEFYHRYVLAVYELQERLITEFPYLLLENCSSGGGRFDAGMLYYSPQIWGSDDTDAVERLAIQEGTQMIFPLSTIGAHVSTCPNHVLGRITPFRTRGFVALAGTFGYELDITKIAEEERALIPGQVALYKKYNDLIRTGDYYRIASYRENNEWDAWGVVSKDRHEALYTLVQVMNRPNYKARRVVLKGVDEAKTYCVKVQDSNGNSTDLGKWSGATLLNMGINMQRMGGDYQSQLIHLIEE